MRDPEVKFFLGVSALMFLLWLAMGIVYVVLHFVLKYW